MNRCALALLLALPSTVLAGPAEVREHELALRLDRGTVTQTWSVLLTGSASAGLPAPPGMTGAEADGARVVRDLLLMPPDAEVDRLYTLEQTDRVARSGASGLFRSVPSLPHGPVRAELRGTSRAPLVVWVDDSAALDRQPGSSLVAEATWAADNDASLVWSSWPSWEALGTSWSADVDRLLGPGDSLNRRLTRPDLAGLGVEGIADEVRAVVSTGAGDVGRLQSARPVAKVLETGRGTAVERALVLIAVLRHAGFSAELAWMQPATSGTVPHAGAITRELATRPAVRVEREGRPVRWLDPAAAHGSRDDVPGAFVGAMALTEDAPPQRLGVVQPIDGIVRIDGSGEIGRDGELRISAVLTATPGTQDTLRSLLAPLSEDERSELLAATLTGGRDDGLRAHVRTHHLAEASEDLRLDVQLVLPGAFDAEGAGYRAELPPLAAPALAAWIPGDVRVEESLVLRTPRGHDLYRVDAASPVLDPRGALTAVAYPSDGGVRLFTTVERRSRQVSDREAAAFYGEAAADFTSRLHWLPTPTPDSARRAQREAWGQNKPESVAIATMMTLRSGPLKRARKPLRGADRVAVAPFFADQLLVEPEVALAVLWESAESDEERLAVVQSAERAGALRYAWHRAAELVHSLVPSVRRSANLTVLDLQSADQPDALTSPEDNQAWFEPELLLRWAHEADANVSEHDPRLVARDVQALLDNGAVDEAEEAVRQALSAQDDPDLHLLAADIAVARLHGSQAVQQHVSAAIERASQDAGYHLRAAALLEAVGEDERGLDLRLRAARLRGDDPVLWLDVSQRATVLLQQERAVAAALAAVRAERSPATDAWLTQLARLTGDTSLAQRVDARPDNRALSALLDDIDPSLRPALLAWRSHEVQQSADALALRAIDRLGRGDAAGASYDAQWLATALDDERGAFLLHASATGHTLGIPEAAPVDSDTARVAIRLTALVDAYPLSALRPLAPDDPLLARLSETPRGAAPTGTRPAGYRDHRAHSSEAPHRYWVHRSGLRAVALTHADADELPPPLDYLRPAPLRRYDDGRELFRLDGLALPAWALRVERDGAVWWGVGLTERGAEQALAEALD